MPVPETTIESVAVVPVHVLVFAGCVVIVAKEPTAKFAVFVVTDGVHVPPIKQVYAPACAAVAGLIDKVAVAAPEITPPSTTSTPPFFHLYVTPVPVATTVKVTG